MVLYTLNFLGAKVAKRLHNRCNTKSFFLVENFVDSRKLTYSGEGMSADNFVLNIYSHLTCMLALFGKKKLTEDQIANIFVNTTLEAVESGWPYVRDFIMDSPEFVKTPDIEESDFGKFLMIVVSANFSYIPQFFESGPDRAIIRRSVEKFAAIFDVTPEHFAKKLKEYKSCLSRVNMPSNNIKYAMSKAIFFKYGLNQCQEAYFQRLNTPNPIFLKNLDELMRHYIWDWQSFQDKFKVKVKEEASSKVY